MLRNDKNALEAVAVASWLFPEMEINTALKLLFIYYVCELMDKPMILDQRFGTLWNGVL